MMDGAGTYAGHGTYSTSIAYLCAGTLGTDGRSPECAETRGRPWGERGIDVESSRGDIKMG